MTVAVSIALMPAMSAFAGAQENGGKAIGKQRVEEAKVLGVTPGKVRLVEKLEASTTEEIDRSVWVEKSVQEIQAAVKENRSEAKAPEAPVDSPVVEPVAEAPEAPALAPVVETPVEEAPVVEAPIIEAPIAETPSDPAPETEAPSEETPETEDQELVSEAPEVEAAPEETASEGSNAVIEVVNQVIETVVNVVTEIVDTVVEFIFPSDEEVLEDEASEVSEDASDIMTNPDSVIVENPVQGESATEETPEADESLQTN